MRLNSASLLWMAILAAALYDHENYWRAIWWDKWVFVMLALTVFCGIKLKSKFHWSACIFFIVTAISALRSFAWFPMYQGKSLDMMVAGGKVTAYTFGAIFAFATALFHMKKKDFDKAMDYVTALALGNAAVIIYQSLTATPAPQRGGFFGNPSMSGCFLAFTYPILVMQPRVKLDPPSLVALIKRFVYLSLPVAAIFLTESSQPVGVLFAVLVAYAFAKGKGSFKYLLFPVPALIIVLLAVLRATQENFHEIFSSTGRLSTYKLMLSWWQSSGELLLGHGTGISQILLGSLQKQGILLKAYNGDGSWWMWLHSDWLQLLVEAGVLGFASGVAMYVFACRRAYTTPWLFAAVVGVGATALFNFPAHLPIHAIVGSTILALALRKHTLQDDFEDHNDRIYQKAEVLASIVRGDFKGEIRKA